MLALFKGAVTKNSHRAYYHEIKALLWFASSLFLTLALVSYHSSDNSWFYFSTVCQPIGNWCGTVGAQAAAVLFYLFGSAALVLAAFCFFMFSFQLQQRAMSAEWDRVIAHGLLLIVLSSLLAVHEIDFFSSPLAGGYCGRLISSLLYAHFDTVGTFIFLYTVLVAVLIVLLRFSFVRIIQYLWRHFSLNGVRILVVHPLCVCLRAVGYPLKKMYRFLSQMYQSKVRVSLPGKQESPAYDRQAWHELMNPTPKKKMPEVHQQKIDPLVAVSAVPPVDAQAVPMITPSTVMPDESFEPLYELPQLDMFIGVEEEHNDHALMAELEKRAVILQEKLERFDVFGKVTAIKRGPVVTLFEYQPQIDTKISKIVALEDDLALALQATSIRIIAPIPGKSLVGFEVANKLRRSVTLASLIKSEAYQETKAALPMILGVDTIGNAIVIDLAKMPHLLMAGSTGSGKSVALNAMLISLLCKITPDDLRLIVIDPKRLEFAPYADIAHLLFPIVTDPKLAPSVLRWVVKQMEQRYEIMAKSGARNIHDYRARAAVEKFDNMPFIVVIIDELADLMMTASKEVEDAIIRITQMARAAGIHLISATQRPSVDVITGLIKVNFPSRISFRVTSKIDSRTILDASGAEKLLGRGDMLFLDSNDSLLKRIHGAYVLDKEINLVIDHIRSQRPADYLDLKQVCHDDRAASADLEKDEMYEEICNYLGEIEEVSISLLQRRFRIGYNRSARIIDMLESQGLIAPSYGGKTRKVIR